MKPIRTAMLSAALALAITPAFADGISDPMKARAACEKQGKAGNEKDLRRCCDNVILLASAAEQKKAVNQCVAGKAAEKPKK